MKSNFRCRTVGLGGPSLYIPKTIHTFFFFFFFFYQLFTDGTTNKLVGCYVDDSPDDVVLVRVYGNKTELIVDRDNELKIFQVLGSSTRKCLDHRCMPSYTYVLCLSMSFPNRCYMLMDVLLASTALFRMASAMSSFRGMPLGPRISRIPPYLGQVTATS